MTSEYIESALLQLILNHRWRCFMTVGFGPGRGSRAVSRSSIEYDEPSARSAWKTRSIIARMDEFVVGIPNQDRGGCGSSGSPWTTDRFDRRRIRARVHRNTKGFHRMSSARTPQSLPTAGASFIAKVAVAAPDLGYFSPALNSMPQ